MPRGTEPFSDAELVALWAKMRELDYEPVYVAICKAALTTGARQGELIAADWRDLNVGAGTLDIRGHYDRVTSTVTTPKDNEPRIVYLTAPARKVFEEWVRREGVQPDGAPIFPAPRSQGRLNGQYVTRLVAHAMVKADIPTKGKDGRSRKPFHALRSTFDRILRERGANLEFA
jgi:integrase